MKSHPDMNLLDIFEIGEMMEHILSFVPLYVYGRLCCTSHAVNHYVGHSQIYLKMLELYHLRTDAKLYKYFDDIYIPSIKEEFFIMTCLQSDTKMALSIYHKSRNLNLGFAINVARYTKQNEILDVLYKIYPKSKFFPRMYVDHPTWYNIVDKILWELEPFNPLLSKCYEKKVSLMDRIIAKNIREYMIEQNINFGELNVYQIKSCIEQLYSPLSQNSAMPSAKELARLLINAWRNTDCSKIYGLVREKPRNLTLNEIMRIEILYLKVRKCSAYNFLTCKFILYKLCQLLELNEHAKFFYFSCPELCGYNRDTIYTKNFYWSKVCRIKRWEFIPTN